MKTQEKVWTRKPDGTFKVTGDVNSICVLMSWLKDGEWSKPYVTYKRKAAEDIIEAAINNGKAPADAYRLTPALVSERMLVRKVKSSQGPREDEPTGEVKARKFKEEETKTERKEPEMAKKSKAVVKEAAEKVGGIFRDGTALAYLYEVFEDEKPHSEKKVLGELTKKFGCKGLQGSWRIRRFREKGEELGKFALIRDGEEGTLQLKFGKSAGKVSKAEKKQPKEKATAKSKKASSRKGGASSDEDMDESKQAKLVAKLIRSAMAADTKKSWTKNKLVEHLSDKFEIEADATRAALKSEIKNGGIEEEDGVLTLSSF
jgi:hypothetical protein